MRRLIRPTNTYLMLFFDGLCVTASYLLAYLLRFEGEIPLKWWEAIKSTLQARPLLFLWPLQGDVAIHQLVRPIQCVQGNLNLIHFHHFSDSFYLSVSGIPSFCFYPGLDPHLHFHLRHSRRHPPSSLRERETSLLCASTERLPIPKNEVKKKTSDHWRR